MSNQRRPRRRPASDFAEARGGSAVRILHPSLVTKKIRAQIMLAFIREHRYDDAAFAEVLSDFQSRAARSTGRDADKQTFLRGQPASVGRCFLIAHRDDFIENLAIEHCRNESSADTL